MTAQILQFTKATEPEQKCSFCKRKKGKVPHKRLIDNQQGHCICMDCITRCKEILTETSE